jgi:hypothetical protein
MRKTWLARDRVFDRRIHHTVYVNKAFQSVCSDLEQMGPAILARATSNASSRADKLVIQGDQTLAFFHAEERVTIAPASLESRGPEFASVSLHWDADRRKRLLPSLDAELQVHAIIQSGPSATTAISVVGDFQPPENLIRRLDEMLSRRVIEAVALSFVKTVADMLEAAESQPAKGDPTGV